MNSVALYKYKVFASHFICYLAAALVVLYSLGPLFWAQWSIIDDHEIVSLVGSSDKFTFADIPGALENTEISSSSNAVRFRPSYYAIRFSEVAAWGGKPEYWYAARVSIAITFAIALAWLCLRIAPPLLVLGFLIFTFSRPFWADIFARLGPAETYGALGFSLIIFGLSLRFKEKSNIYASIILSLGVIVAAGSKENFLFLIFIPIWIIFSSWNKLSLAVKLIYFLPIAFASWIIFTITSRLGLSGKDVYSQDISLESRANLLVHFTQRTDVLLWLSCIILIWAALIFLKLRKKHTPSSNLVMQNNILELTFFSTIALLALFFSQYVFYFGRWPHVYEQRYLFPGIIFQYVAVLLFVNLLARIASKFKSARALSQFVVLSGFVFFMGLIKISGIGRGFPESTKIELNGYSRLPEIASNRSAAEKRVDETIEFTRKISDITANLINNPPAAIVFNSHSAGDYEPLFSIERFVRAADISVPIAINFDGYSVKSYPDNPLATDLVETLDDLRNGRAFDKNGREIPVKRRNIFTSPERLGLSENCFSFGFSGPPLEKCKRGAQIWP